MTPDPTMPNYYTANQVIPAQAAGYYQTNPQQANPFMAPPMVPPQVVVVQQQVPQVPQVPTYYPQQQQPNGNDNNTYLNNPSAPLLAGTAPEQPAKTTIPKSQETGNEYNYFE